MIFYKIHICPIGSLIQIKTLHSIIAIAKITDSYLFPETDSIKHSSEDLDQRSLHNFLPSMRLQLLGVFGFTVIKMTMACQVRIIGQKAEILTYMHQCHS